jgi:hypothetical protein
MKSIWWPRGAASTLFDGFSLASTRTPYASSWDPRDHPAEQVAPLHAEEGREDLHTKLIQAGFPPHVVAFWTGRTLTVYERRYRNIEESVDLPRAKRNYGRFGILSAHGQAALRQLPAWPARSGRG